MRASPISTRTRAAATGTCGPISTPATAPRRCSWRSKSKLTGAHVFGIANANSVMSRSNDALLDEVFPGTQRKRPITANESLISIDKAREVLGYEPKYPWRDQVEKAKALKAARG